MKSFSPLFALSPLDGRYSEKLNDLRPFFSEFALIKYRLLVEIDWLMALSKQKNIKEVPSLSKQASQTLMQILENFSQEDAESIKEIEKEIRHDVKAIEYFLKETIKGDAELEKTLEFIHFGCTSEDINNLAYALMLKEARDTVFLPKAKALINRIYDFAKQHAKEPMLSHTHGQPASPSTVGKEMANFVERLKQFYKKIQTAELSAKFNGAVGNFNAHLAAYPKIDWLTLSKRFVEQFDLSWSEYTTQVESRDHLASMLYDICQFNTILIDFNRDMWGYIALGYFQSKPKEQEVGSSTMPHKINPIDFENAEGNLGLSNAICQHLAEKLPISRWQRDLSDSTVLRNLGVGIGHALLAYDATFSGIEKLSLNTMALENSLNEHWEVLAEPIQTIMRRYGLEKPYETLKSLTQHAKVDETQIKAFIHDLDIPKEAKEKLLALSPASYTGNAASQAAKLKKI
jgi:adenylosuccinate lyase